MSSETEQPTALPLPFRLVACFMLLSTALFVGAMADLPHLALVLVVACPVLFIRKRAFAFKERPIVYGILAAIATATVFGYLFPYERGRLGMFSFFFRPEYYMGFWLNLAFVACLFRSRGLAAGMVVAAAVWGLGVCGDCFNSTHTNTRFALLDPLFNRHYSEVYLIFCLLMGACSLIVLHFAVGRQSKEGGWRLRILQAAMGVVLISVIWTGLRFRKAYQEKLRELDYLLMTSAMGTSSYVRGGVTWGGNVNLRESQFGAGRADDSRILLRVTGTCAPGYMRSRSLITYENGQWLEGGQGSDIELDYTEQDGMLSMSIYKRNDAEDAGSIVWDVLVSEDVRASILPVPQVASRIDIAAEDLKLKSNGQFEAERWKRDGGYRVTASVMSTGGAFDLPVIQEGMPVRGDFLQVPDAVLPRLREFAKTIPEVDVSAGAKACGEALKHFFETAYEYGFPQSDSGNVRPDSDPVMEFLTVKRIGHCELFASATVLLLRTWGIPARYVTGFVCTEQGPNGEYYVCRQGHAHAWCEVFDDASGNWFLLDTTPPGGMPNRSSDWSFVAAQRDVLSYLWSKAMADIHRGQLAVVIVEFCKWLWTMLLSLPGGIAVVLAAWAFIWFRRRRRQLPLVSLNAEQKKLARQMEHFMTYWESRLKLPHDEARTPRELLAAMTAAAERKTSDGARRRGGVSDADVSHAREQIEHYECARFGKK